MLKNVVAIVFILVFIVELYLSAAGSSHRKKKKLKDWNTVKGKVESVEKVQDELTRKNVIELTVRTDDGHTVYSKHSPVFCIYEKGEEVELMEKDGVHRFLGNDRVNRQGRKETLLGTLPLLGLILVAAVLSFLSHIWS